MSKLSTLLEKHCEVKNIAGVRSRPTRERPKQSLEMSSPFYYYNPISAASDVSEAGEGQNSVIEAEARKDSAARNRSRLPKRPRLNLQGDDYRDSSPASSTGAEVWDILKSRRPAWPAATEEATPCTSKGLRGSPVASGTRSDHVGPRGRADYTRGRGVARRQVGARGSGPNRANNLINQLRMLSRGGRVLKVPMHASGASSGGDQLDENEAKKRLAFRKNVRILLVHVKRLYQNMPDVGPVSRVEENLKETLKFFHLTCYK